MNEFIKEYILFESFKNCQLCGKKETGECLLNLCPTYRILDVLQNEGLIEFTEDIEIEFEDDDNLLFLPDPDDDDEDYDEDDEHEF